MLSDKEQAILQELERNPYISQQALAEKIDLSRSATANLISKLITKGYILGKAYILNNERTILCIGGTNIDHKLYLKSKLEFYTSNPISSSTTFGGVIRNIAENLGRLDQEVTLLSIIGNDVSGQAILDYSKNYMALSHVDILDNKSTGSYSALLDSNGELVLGIADMDIAEDMDEKWLQNHTQVLKTAKLIVTDTNVQASALNYLVDYTKENKKDLAIIGVSISKAKRVPQNLQNVYLTIFNYDESESYFGTKNEKPEKLVEKWLNKGVQNVVITKGIHGVYYGKEDEIFHLEAIKDIQVVDATGAGDSFSAGVIYGLSQHSDLHDAIRLGQINASQTIQSPDSVRKNLSSQQLEKEKEHYYAN